MNGENGVNNNNQPPIQYGQRHVNYGTVNPPQQNSPAQTAQKRAEARRRAYNADEGLGDFRTLQGRTTPGIIDLRTHKSAGQSPVVNQGNPVPQGQRHHSHGAVQAGMLSNAPREASPQRSTVLNTPAPQPKAPVMQAVAQPKAPVMQPVVQPKAPVMQPVAQPKAPVMQPVAQPKAPVMQPVVQPKAPAMQAIVQPKAPAGRLQRSSQLGSKVPGAVKPGNVQYANALQGNNTRTMPPEEQPRQRSFGNLNPIQPNPAVIYGQTVQVQLRGRSQAEPDAERPQQSGQPANDDIEVIDSFNESFMGSMTDAEGEPLPEGFSLDPGEYTKHITPDISTMNIEGFDMPVSSDDDYVSEEEPKAKRAGFFSGLSKNERKKLKTEIIQWVCIFVVLVAAVVVIGIIFDTPILEHNNMMPTISYGERCLVNKYAYTAEKSPQRGDIVRVEIDGSERLMRVIALPGEAIRIGGGKVYINEELLEESYTLGDTDGDFYGVVPEDCLFLMGDNREVSRDSRDLSIGYVSYSDITGKVLARVWPLNRAGGLYRSAEAEAEATPGAEASEPVAETEENN